MFHSSIITILTTASIALHAMLGCCAHHDHSCCELHGLAAAVQQADEHCSHDHDSPGRHHHDDADSSGEGAEYDCGHQHRHDGGQPHGCDEGDCSFTAVQRASDLELMLTFSMWCQTLYDVAHADTVDSLVALNLAVESPPDPLYTSGTARAISQVWRL